MFLYLVRLWHTYIFYTPPTTQNENKIYTTLNNHYKYKPKITYDRYSNNYMETIHDHNTKWFEDYWIVHTHGN